MDLSTILIVLVVSVVVCLFLLLVFKFDIREKSYEEAIAEQRQQTHALIPKAKTKEKKNKKAAKKAKEQEPPVVQEKSEPETEEHQITSPSPNPKPHVEFNTNPEEVQEVKKRPTKRDKVKSILLNREKSAENLLKGVEPATTNHFEIIHPKDDCELKRANSKDELIKTEAGKIKEAIIETEPAKNGKKAAKLNAVPVSEPQTHEKLKTEPTVDVQPNAIVPNTGKEKKKKKSEFNVLQQLTAERDGLLNLVRKAELSRSEVQILIDLLLNKQQDAPEITEWTEGRFDPVQRLKKQLAEKEKALAEEQAALAGAQAKLREIRAEQQQDRLQLQQKVRGLEEVLQAKQMEIQAGNRLHADLRKLQAQLNDELLRNHQLREEMNSFHQYRVTHSQENDKIVGQLRNEIDELQQHNQRLQMDVHKTQAYMVQYNNTKQELDQSMEINRQVEEAKKELERNIEKLLLERNDWKTDNVKMQSIHQQHLEEMERLKQELFQLHQEHKQFATNNIDNTKLIIQLRNELKIAQEEKLSQLNGTSEENKAHKIELLNLTNELSSVKIDRQTLQQKAVAYEKDLIAAGEKWQALQTELEEQKAKNNELRTKNWKVMEALNAAESKLNASSKSKQKDVDVNAMIEEVKRKEQQNQVKFIGTLFPEIDALKHLASSDNWQNETSKLIKCYINNLQSKQTTVERMESSDDSEEIAQLKAQLQYYKKLFDDTANVLNGIERNVQEEEIKWRSQLAEKEAELQHLKEQVLLPLRTRVTTLETELNGENKQLGDKNSSRSELLVNKLSDAQNHNSFSSNGAVS